MELIYCRIADGKVVDRSLWLDPMPETFPNYSEWVQNNEWQIGWIDDGAGGFKEPPIDILLE